MEGKFQLIPNITTVTNSGRQVIINTKYKLLHREDRKLGVSQADLYQMYAYGTQWNVDAMISLYPDIWGSPVSKEWHFNIRLHISSAIKRVSIAVRGIKLWVHLS